MKAPIVKKKQGISPIWILPVVALLIGGWLLYKGIHDAGVTIIVHFEDAEGITPGKTRVMSRGIPIGIVRNAMVDRGMKGVSLYIEMDSIIRESLVEDTKFWLVRPQISAGKVSGLNTLISGSHIETLPGVSKIISREFNGLPEAPPVSNNAPGLHIKLMTGALNSIQKGSQIYYNNIPVGSVQGYTLVNDKKIMIDAYIEPEYSNLIKIETRFWNASGITLKGDLSNFRLHMESLAALVYGGIGMYTPEPKTNSPFALNGQIFTLYPDLDDARFGIDMTLQLHSAEGLKANVTKIICHGFEVGTVTALTFDRNKKCTVTADIIINPEAEFILREKTIFWVARPQISINKIKNLEILIKGTHISLEPGEGKFCNHFTVQEQPDSEKILSPGSSFRLVSENAQPFSIGAPVLYKKIQIGEITNFDLDSDGSHVLANIFIYKKYVHLIRSNSVFWNAGDLEINADLDGISLKTGTIASMFAGGVAFANPKAKSKADAKPANENKSFILYKNYQKAIDATPALQAEGIRVRLQASNLKSISPGSPVLYKQIKVGEITGFHLAKNGANIILNAFIQDEYAHLIKTTNRFYNASGIDIEGGLSGIHLKTASLKSIIAGGIAFFITAKGEEAGESKLFTLYDDYQTALDADKTKMVFRFAKPNGLKKGVEIKYQGITIGKVQKVKYGKVLDSVIAETLVEKSFSILFRDDTRIWLVNAEFSLSGVKNLETVITGPYIEVKPGKGNPVAEITALDSPPRIEKVREGLNIVLETPGLGSLKKGSPVYYRQLIIGKVTGYKLSPTAQEVWVYLNINKPYDIIVHKNTRFWNVSGIKVDAGIFSGVEIDTESIEAIVAGGIAMATPESDEGDKKGTLAPEGHHFILHPKSKKKWLSWKPLYENDNF